ncbi:MAG: riboflavin synthase [Kiritimatiellae bacterium]|nr:riboflavin synthase [Kiritimatiellia bacterium]
MFTGLVEKIGTLKRISRGAGVVLEIGFEPWARPLERGESVAVNGVCLTVVDFDEKRFTADVLRETEERTGLGALVPGAKVNLERALRAQDPLGGHIVQGHVDCRGKIVAKDPRGRDFRLKIRCSRVLAAQSVVKGSIAVDGVSLTITGLGVDWVSVDLIPTTLRDTTLGLKRIGDEVNLEGDVMGKYAAKAAAPSGLTEDALMRAGFIDV